MSAKDWELTTGLPWLLKTMSTMRITLPEPAQTNFHKESEFWEIMLASLSNQVNASALANLALTSSAHSQHLALVSVALRVPVPCLKEAHKSSILALFLSSSSSCSSTPSTSPWSELSGASFKWAPPRLFLKETIKQKEHETCCVMHTPTHPTIRACLTEGFCFSDAQTWVSTSVWLLTGLEPLQLRLSHPPSL